MFVDKEVHEEKGFDNYLNMLILTKTSYSRPNYLTLKLWNITSQFSSEPEIIDQNSEVNEEQDLPLTVSDARKTLHTHQKILENR